MLKPQDFWKQLKRKEWAWIINNLIGNPNTAAEATDLNEEMAFMTSWLEAGPDIRIAVILG